ncbi:hypothetical protein CEY16_13115 [Halalkalibacillus sediminis]|uniref:DUF2178 domain-containing protein n=1 Tax=Halalkalibacillus sediminis TaxID=2018042 RepID=A0A2I0QQZ5_9BACI|nr:hypothetical protein [Halalkalibacillus sediminis]PKR76754.1 hypothetical protein CEY16_13115 [Halalkalibacillus sediminis]
MNKKDFRIQYPLWMIALYIILAFWTYGVVYTVDISLNDFEDVFVVEDGGMYVALNTLPVISIILGSLLLTIFFVFYSFKVKRHNKENPDDKLGATFLYNATEFLEKDEMWKQVTQKATKKVYTFYLQALPLLVVVMYFPLDRYIFILLVYAMLIIHNVIYYREIRQYVEE